MTFALCTIACVLVYLRLFRDGGRDVDAHKPCIKCGEEVCFPVMNQDSLTRSILHVHQQRLPVFAANGFGASPMHLITKEQLADV